MIEHVRNFDTEWRNPYKPTQSAFFNGVSCISGTASSSMRVQGVARVGNLESTSLSPRQANQHLIKTVYGLTLTYFHGMPLSGHCTNSIVFFAPQFSAC